MSIVKIELGSVAQPEPDYPNRRIVICYVWSESDAGGSSDDGDTVRDTNHALELARGLAVGPHCRMEAPPADGEYRPLFLQWIGISNTRGKTSRYFTDYLRYDGCPAFVSEHAMLMHRQIRAMVRESKKVYRQIKNKKERNK